MTFWTKWLIVGAAAEAYALIPGSRITTLSTYWRDQVHNLPPHQATLVSVGTFAALVWLVPHWGFRNFGWWDDAVAIAAGALLGLAAARGIRKRK